MVGLGAVFTAITAYVGKAYKTSENRHTGKIIGSVYLAIPLCYILMYVATLLIALNLTWLLVVSCTNILAALLWYYFAKPVCTTDQHNAVFVHDKQGVCA